MTAMLSSRLNHTGENVFEIEYFSSMMMMMTAIMIGFYYSNIRLIRVSHKFDSDFRDEVRQAAQVWLICGFISEDV